MGGNPSMASRVSDLQRGDGWRQAPWSSSRSVQIILAENCGLPLIIQVKNRMLKAPNPRWDP